MTRGQVAVKLFGARRDAERRGDLVVVDLLGDHVESQESAGWGGDGQVTVRFACDDWTRLRTEHAKTSRGLCLPARKFAVQLSAYLGTDSLPSLGSVAPRLERRRAVPIAC